MKVEKSKGLEIAIKVMDKVKKTIKDEELDCEIYLDTFNNCRETGFVYKLYRKGKPLYIWTFQDRISDDMILLISFQEGACDKNNMFDDDHVYSRTVFKYKEMKELSDRVANLVLSFGQGVYDDDKF